MQRLPYLSDPKLISRVQNYLEANVDKNYIDIGSMADELQSTYREYSRKKRNAFRTSVEKAYSVVLRSYNLADQSDDTSEEKIEEDVDSENSRESHFHKNLMNNQLVEIYKRPTPSIPKMNINELIDISSDDSKDESKLPPANASNGPSTSSKATRIDLSNNFKENMEKISVHQGKKRKLNRPNESNKKRKIEPNIPEVNLEDILGIDSIVNELKVELLFHLKFPEYYDFEKKRKPLRTFLLHGPSGSGKSFLGNAIAGHLNFPIITFMLSKHESDNDKSITDMFRDARCAAPAVLLLEKIDNVLNDLPGSVKSSSISDVIIECLEELKKSDDQLLVIATAENINSIKPSVLRHFSNKIRLTLPDAENRIKILKAYTSGWNFKPDFDWNRISYVTPGYCAADLEEMVDIAWQKSLTKVVQEDYIHFIEKDKKEIVIAEDLNSQKIEPDIIVDDDSKETSDKDRGNSIQNDNMVLVIEDENSKQEEIDISSLGVSAEAKDEEMREPSPERETHEVSEQKKAYDTSILEKIGHQKARCEIVMTEEDFLQAAKKIQSMSIKKGVIKVPIACWDDIGALQDVRAIVEKIFLKPIKMRKQYSEMKFEFRGGLLLCGPPGCGKTLLAKVLASEAHLNFFSVKGPQFMNKYVGESERFIRDCFEDARQSAPSVIFFDEIDALCPKRQGSGEGNFIDRVVAAMLAEMDGIEPLEGVYLLGATNRPDVIDPAIMRPGRFDKVVYVGVPSPEDRVEILKTLSRDHKLAPDVDLEDIGRSEKLSGCTGADLKHFLHEVKGNCLDRNSTFVIIKEDFEKALKDISPSVSQEVLQCYGKIREQYCKNS